MKKQQVVWNFATGLIALVTLASMPFQAAATTEQQKTMSAEYQVTSSTKLSLDSGVGEIKFIATSGDTLSVTLTAKADSDKMWNDGDLEAVQLTAKQDGDRLVLSVPEQDNVKLDWVIQLPKIASVDADLGVGTIGGEMWTTDINLDVGVGEVDLELRGDLAIITSDIGIGDSQVKGVAEVENNRFLMTASSKGRGAGTAVVSINLGVGDSNVKVSTY